MNLEITNYAYGEKPKVTLPDPDFLKLLTEPGMRKLVSDHYDLLRQSGVRNLFPKDAEEFEQAKLRSSDFLIQICGGPEHYNINRGQPMLTRRHAPFSITLESRTIWLECYKSVLSQLSLPVNLIQSFWDYINVFSIWMVNTEL